MPSSIVGIMFSLCSSCMLYVDSRGMTGTTWPWCGREVRSKCTWTRKIGLQSPFPVNIIFFRIVSHFYVGSLIVMPPFTGSCASSPDNSLSEKSFMMLSNHLRFGLPLILSLAPPSPSLYCQHIPFLFSIQAHTTSTFIPVLSWIFPPPSLSL